MVSLIMFQYPAVLNNYFKCWINCPDDIADYVTPTIRVIWILSVASICIAHFEKELYPGIESGYANVCTIVWEDAGLNARADGNFCCATKVGKNCKQLVQSTLIIADTLGM